LNSNGDLTWNTFLGGDSWDNAKGITVDASGKIYVVGDSEGVWVGETPIRNYASGKDAWVVQLASNGSLNWLTFLGGTGTDDGMVVTTDSDSVYIAGYCNGTFTGETPVRARSSGTDAFVAKYTTAGALTWHTFLGGTGYDEVIGIAVDSGNIYVSGFSTADWGTSPARSYTGASDIFAGKLDSSGVLTWHTFLGGSGDDYGVGMTLDSSKNIYVTGWSDATWGSPDRLYSSSFDAVAAKLSNSGSLTWNTFLGGTSSDYGYGIAVDSSNNVYIGGGSNLGWGTSPLLAYSDGEDVVVIKLGIPETSGNARVAGKFSPVDRTFLFVPLALFSGLVLGGSLFLVLRRRRSR
jgi:hypothetical protein